MPGGFDGSYALQLAGLKSFGSFGVNDSPNWVAHTGASGRRYRFNAWVKSDQARGTARLRVREDDRSTPLSGAHSAGGVLFATWQKMSMDQVPGGSGATLEFQIVDFPVADQ